MPSGKYCVYVHVVVRAAAYLLQLKLCRQSLCDSVDETREGK